MKLRHFAAGLIICILLITGGCSLQKNNEPQEEINGGQDMFTDDFLLYKRERNNNFLRAVWISYLDIATLMSPDKNSFENNIDTMLNNLATISVTDIYFQVRAFGDSFYPSRVYPSASETTYAMLKDFDYLKIVLDKAHARGIKLHAWINPYRLHSSNSDIYRAFIDGLISQDSKCVESTETGRTLNPASKVAQKLVVDGVKELIDNYKIDGVHLDDYFYPTTDEAFDAGYYADYTAGGGSMQLDEWRRDNVSAVIKEVYSAVKSKSGDIEFGIAPDASIDRNMNKHYLDVELMCKTPGYLDYICPQIYFGYQNQSMPFLATAAQWAALSTGCKLIVGLSFYKVGIADQYAGVGSDEWLESCDIISRQYLDSLEITNCAGVAFYRYNSIFNPDTAAAASAEGELKNLQQVI